VTVEWWVVDQIGRMSGRLIYPEGERPMLTLRCTQRLIKHLKVQVAPAVPEPSNTLGDWHAGLLSYDDADIALCLNDRTRYVIPILLHDAQDDHSLYMNLTWRIAEAVERLGFSKLIADQIFKEYQGGMRIAATNSRSLLGTINDLARLMEYEIEEICEAGKPMDWRDMWRHVEDKLNQTPLMPMDGDSGAMRLRSLLRDQRP
jgi:hypothetical protein